MSNGRLDRPDRGYVLSRLYVGSCAHLNHVRNWNREEQELRGGRHDQSRFRTVLVNRASSRETSAPTTFVIDLFSTGTDYSGAQCARLDPFSEDACSLISESSRDFVHPGKWSDPRRSGMAVRCHVARDTSCVALVCEWPSMHQF